jgi:NADH-quinone oxidoreductase subunit L
MHHEQDIWQMGNLRKKMPITFWTFLVGALALSGVPPFSGFYSKDSILAQALEQKNYLLFGVAVFVAALTAFYTFRLFFVVFFGGEKSKAASHAHESPLVMTLPLVALAVFAAIGGVIGVSGIIEKHYLDSGLTQFTALGYRTWDHNEYEISQNAFLNQLCEPFTVAPIPAVIGLISVVIGFMAARTFYRNAASDPLPAKLGGLATAMKNKFYFDELYEATFIRAHDFIATVMDVIDRWFVEGFCIGLVRGGTDFTGRALRLVQTGNLQTYAFLFVLGVAALLYLVLGK